MDKLREVHLWDGKYTIQISDDMKVFKALRYGEEWQDLTGNNLIHALFTKVEELEEELRNKK